MPGLELTYYTVIGMQRCVRSSMLHGSETWPVKKENEVALQRAETRIMSDGCVMLR